MNRRIIMLLAAAAVLTLRSLGAESITVPDLRARLNANAKITLIDVRNLGLYERGHIPGAINLPAVFVAEKKLPPLGEVVVYDGGLGRDDAKIAAAALNAKPGINARILEGGLAAWQQAGSPSTHPQGMRPEEVSLITYADLKTAQSNGVVLVDLRKPVLQSRQGVEGAPAPAPLTDLRAEFPAAPVTKSPFNLPQTRQSLGSAPPLLVLIDSGDGAAQAMAASLKANGISRFVILAGGETILARKGEPGLERVTTSTESPSGDSNP